MFSPAAGTCRAAGEFFHAGMAELADASDLGSGGKPCRFKSCCPQSAGLFILRPLYVDLFIPRTVLIKAFLKLSSLFAGQPAGREFFVASVFFVCIKNIYNMYRYVRF